MDKNTLHEIDIDETIFPNRMRYNGFVYDIKYLHDNFIITNAIITYSDETNTITRVTIGKKFHPNAKPTEPVTTKHTRLINPFTGIWCIPSGIKQKKFKTIDEVFEIIPTIMKLIATWNYDDCYWKTFDSDIAKFVEMRPKKKPFKTIRPPSSFDRIVDKYFNKSKAWIDNLITRKVRF